MEGFSGLKICLALYIVAIAVDSNDQRCIKIGESFTISYTFKPLIEAELDFAWFKNESSVSYCYNGKKCMDYRKIKTNTSYVYNKETSTVETNLTIFNASKGDNGVWSLRYLGTPVLTNKEKLYFCEVHTLDDNWCRRTNQNQQSGAIIVICSAFASCMVVVLMCVAIQLLRRKNMKVSRGDRVSPRETKANLRNIYINGLDEKEIRKQKYIILGSGVDI